MRKIKIKFVFLEKIPKNNFERQIHFAFNQLGSYGKQDPTSSIKGTALWEEEFKGNFPSMDWLLDLFSIQRANLNYVLSKKTFLLGKFRNKYLPIVLFCPFKRRKGGFVIKLFTLHNFLDKSLRLPL